MPKECIRHEWTRGFDDAIEAETRAFCKQTKERGRGHAAFVNTAKPVIAGD